MRRKVIALSAVAAMILSTLTACSESGASSSSGGGGNTVVVAGSTSVQPFIEVLAAEYEEVYGGSPVDVQGGGSSAGIVAARDRIANIGMSSRGLRGDELELEHVTIALDGLALIVHPDNPVRDLTLPQIRDIYTGKVTDWSWLCSEFTFDDDDEPEVNSNCGNCDFCKFEGGIHVVTREEGSGTRGAFEEMVMNWKTTAVVEASIAPDYKCEECTICETILCEVCTHCTCRECENICSECDEECKEHKGCTNCVACEAHTGKINVYQDTNHSADIHGRTIVLNTNGAIRQFVAGNPNAIGYISLGTVEIDGLDPVIGVRIGGVEPTPENVLNESYGLFRPFIFIIGGDEDEPASPETRTFVEFILSNEGQGFLTEKYGLVQSPDASGLSFTGGAA
jgi:ABC-type phosphate transport system substrate-binding protein